MDKITVSADSTLVEQAVTVFPAAIVVTLRGGGVVTRRVTAPPGSPGDAWELDDVVAKFARLDRTGRSGPSIEHIAGAVSALIDAPDVADVMAAVA